MPPPGILNLDELDLDRQLHTHEQIYALIPQRFEFEQLGHVVHLNTQDATIAGVRDIRNDEWWCRGHLPAKPIFPGILMIECAAQLAAFFRELVMPSPGEFMGFGGVDNAKFRGAIFPPARLAMVGKGVELRPRRFVCDMQGYVDGSMVFEARITGMPVKLG